MRMIGSVELPQEAFLTVLKYDEEWERAFISIFPIAKEDVNTVIFYLLQTLIMWKNI